MISAPIRLACEQVIQSTIQKVSYIGGGDINEARLLETTRGRFFLKWNSANFAFDMLQKEGNALQLIGATESIAVPSVILIDKVDNTAFLLLEYIESGLKNNLFWEGFGRDLAILHQHTQHIYGLNYFNYIGRLIQSNSGHLNWVDFYISERIQPQVKAARDNNWFTSFDLSQFDRLYQRLPSILIEEKPTLIHGDLWGGNYLASVSGKAYLIDPAICYAHREMDLAMSQLFGGFAPRFYQAYQEKFPTEKGLEQRIELYQLYYLLVHVNLFGSGYLGSVRSILKRYS